MTNPNAHKVLDLVFSKEPLSPVVANKQSQWFDLVKWVTYALIRAEELGINSQNIDSFAQSKNAEIKRFLGVEGKLGKNWDYLTILRLMLSSTSAIMVKSINATSDNLLDWKGV